MSAMAQAAHVPVPILAAFAMNWANCLITAGGAEAAAGRAKLLRG